MKRFGLIIIFILTVIVMQFGTLDTKAVDDVNGGGIGTGSSGNADSPGSGCNDLDTTSRLCIIIPEQSNYGIIRVTLVEAKKSGGKWTRKQIGDSIYFSNNSLGSSIVVNYLDLSGNLKNETVKKDDRYFVQNWFMKDKKLSSSLVLNYFLNEARTKLNATHTLDNVVKKMNLETYDKNHNTKFSEHFNSEKNLKSFLQTSYSSGVEYRLLIEPVTKFITGSKGNKKTVYYTAKAVATKDLTNGKRWFEIANVLYLDQSDIGLSKGTFYTGDDSHTDIKKNLKNPSSGQGYNLIYFYDKDELKQDYCDYTNVDHFITNKNGTATSSKGSGPNGENCCNVDALMEIYKAQYAKLNGGQKLTDNEMKEYIYRLHPYCISGYEPNPTNNDAICNENQIAVYDQGADEFALLSTLYNTTLYNGSSNIYLKKNIDNYAKILCSEKVTINFPKAYKEVVYRGTKLEWPTYENGLRNNNYPLSLEGKATCVLFIDQLALKRDGSSNTVKTYKNKINDYIDDFYNLSGNFSVKYNDKKYGKTISLEKVAFDSSLTYKKLGEYNNILKFTLEDKATYKIPDATYRYIMLGSSLSVDKPINNNYIDLKYGNLPIATDAKGSYNISILYDSIGGFGSKIDFDNTKDYVCKYKVDPDIETSCKCPVGTEKQGRDLSSCMMGGCDGNTYTCEDAKKKFCDGTTILDVCPEGTTYAGNKVEKKCLEDEKCWKLVCNEYVCSPETDCAGKHIEKSLITQYMNNKKITLEEALKIIYASPYCNLKSGSLIYRVIDLNNPFPGKAGSGRTPGFNWNNVKLINDYITNNRSVTTNEVYKNDAMYHFKLDVATLKEIRKYNKSNSYGDFKLTCDSTTGRNCISNFVHNSSYGIQQDSDCYLTGDYKTCQKIKSKA